MQVPEAEALAFVGLELKRGSCSETNLPDSGQRAHRLRYSRPRLREPVGHTIQLRAELQSPRLAEGNTIGTLIVSSQSLTMAGRAHLHTSKVRPPLAPKRLRADSGPTFWTMSPWTIASLSPSGITTQKRLPLPRTTTEAGTWGWCQKTWRQY